MLKQGLRSIAIAALPALAIALPAGAYAAEAEARAILKAMSDYMAAQQNFTIEYDTGLEVVTTDKQKIQLASSGSIAVSRPDKMRVRRTGGFADVEFIFDGKMLTVHGMHSNVYVQAEMPGTIINSSTACARSSTSPCPARTYSRRTSMTCSWKALPKSRIWAPA